MHVARLEVDVVVVSCGDGDFVNTQITTEEDNAA